MKEGEESVSSLRRAPSNIYSFLLLRRAKPPSASDEALTMLRHSDPIAVRMIQSTEQLRL